MPRFFKNKFSSLEPAEIILVYVKIMKEEENNKET